MWFKSNPHSLNQGLTIGQGVIFHALNLKPSILPSSPSNERLNMMGLLKCEGQLIFKSSNVKTRAFNFLKNN